MAGGHCQTSRIDSVRIDQWLHAVRITKTRSDAAAACRGGHVKINGAAAKPSSAVKVGDHVEARFNQRERIVDVTKVIAKRVGAATAAACFPNETRSNLCSRCAIAAPADRRNETVARSTAFAAEAGERRAESRVDAPGDPVERRGSLFPR
jgi:ribosome-associated heat shock protein Hsp15